MVRARTGGAYQPANREIMLISKPSRPLPPKVFKPIRRQLRVVHRPVNRFAELTTNASSRLAGFHGTYHYQSSYFPMSNPVNIAIYAFGGFMLLALAIGFFAAPM
jgi:hypothetical protein